ncbi:MAG: ATP-binding protein [Pseudomonadota bacterium]
MSSSRCHHVYAALLLLCLSATAAYAEDIAISSLDQPASIAGTWKFQTGDRSEWANPELDDSGWTTLPVPSAGPEGHEDYAGIAWYRVTLQLDIDNQRVREQLGALGLTLGYIMSAYELYVGGQKVGAVGALPPNAEMVYDQIKTFAIPRSAVDEQGRIRLALRVWRYEKLGKNWEMGPYDGPFLLGNIGDLRVDQLERSIFPNLILSVIYLVIGIYHILIARQKPELQEFLWFGLLAIALAAYSFELSQWRFNTGLPYLVHKKIEFFCLYVSPFLLTETLKRVLKIELNRFARIFQYAFLLAALAVLVVPNQNIHFETLSSLQYMGVLWSIGAASIIGWQAFHGNRRARLILVLLLVLAASLINDVFFDAAVSGGLKLINFGFATVIILMSVVLAERYTNILSRLEILVDQRTAELQESNNKLQDALSAKSQFLANMSHEFRTPMHAITGMVGLVLKTDLNKKQRNYLATVDNAAKALRGIIDNILDFASLDAGEMEKSAADFEVSEVVRTVSSLAMLKAEEKGLHYDAIVDDSVPKTLIGDAKRIAQVLGQLVDNGIKFTEQGDVRLGITLLSQDDTQATIEFSVRDSGIGISEGDQVGLYDAFSQADYSHRRQHGGTGLGLALSRQLVELMDGEMTFESEPGKGSCFSFSLTLGVGELA